MTTVTEDDVALATAGPKVRTRCHDSVGVGSYRIDLHPSTGGDSYIDVGSVPFEIPLGALLPVRVRNLLPAAKNIGTTHITNGCHRLHPVEWSVGEVAGPARGVLPRPPGRAASGPRGRPAACRLPPGLRPGRRRATLAGRARLLKEALLVTAIDTPSTRAPAGPWRKPSKRGSSRRLDQ